jgi:poly-gamma-glutamate synthesis protein (capsule biosynthesis protein)
VGVLAAAQFLNTAAGRPWVHVADYEDPGEAERFRALVRQESRRVDLLIVSYHGDAEYIGTPSPSKRRFFASLVDSGAHVVLGHHPHVVQGWETTTVEGGTRLAMHSLGNFISGMTWRLSPSDSPGELPPRGESYLLCVQVLLTGGTVSVQAVDAVPIANYRNERGEMVVARMRDLADGTVRVPAAWASYWAARLALMEQRISAWRAGQLR